MKRPLSLLLALGLMLSLVGCAETEQHDPEKLRIVTTLFPYYDLARTIAGEKAEITLLCGAGRESHSYEPTPRDILRITEADVFLYNGGVDETWATELLTATEHGLVFTGMDYVDVREEGEIESATSHEHGHDHDDDHDEHEHAHEIEYDEHIWTSPKNMMRLADGLFSLLIEHDSANAAYYGENYLHYIAELQRLDEAFTALSTEAEHPTLLFGDRFPFLYFCEDYGFGYEAAFLGCSTETEPSAATMRALIESAKEQHGGYVYYLENSSARVAEAVAEAAGAETAMLCSCQSITPEDFRNGETYLTLMQRNYDTLAKGVAR